MSTEVYIDRLRYHTVVGITDLGVDGVANLDAKNDVNIVKNATKHEGMLFIALALRLSAKIKLKNI